MHHPDLPPELVGAGIVYFGNDWRAENRTSSHHIAVRLAQRLPVLYVDSPGMRAPNASGRDIKRALRKLRDALRPPQAIGEGLWLCTVPQLPLRKLPGVNTLNRLFGRWAVRRAARKIGMQRRLSWFVVPHPGFLARQLDERLCVYYCTDDYAAHPGVDQVAIRHRDESLTREADLVFVVPPALLDSKQAMNPRSVYAPHGVDVALFSAASDPATRPPQPVPSDRPVVGYFGSIHDWIDIPLIAWLAQQRPQWTFLLVGHPHADVSSLQALPNVMLTGAQPYPTLPQWASAFDAAIIPYRQNQQIANANPLKLREYLATGRPVVSARNPEIEKFAHLVAICDSREEFLAALDRAVLDKDPATAAARIASVADQTWERRVQDILAQVGQTLRAVPAR